MYFEDRRHAGQILGRCLGAYRDDPDVLVLALPRGGVPVAFEVARALRAPLDVFLVRKLGTPGHEEFAMGAIASGGVRVMNPDVEELQIPPQAVEAVAAREGRELQRREQLYRGNMPPLAIGGKVAILVDDGLATGSTMRAAAKAVRRHGPNRVVVAVPVAAADACRALRAEVDDVLCMRTPQPFYAVGAWYEKFDQTTDEEVRRLLAAAREFAPRPTADAS